MGYGGKEVKQLKKGEHNHTGRQRKFQHVVTIGLS